jgi:transposase
MTIFTDLKRGRILHAIEGRTKQDIRPFLEQLASKAKNLQAIAMDMSHSYYWAAQEVLPNVDIVFDRYHIMALMSHAIDEVRRNLQHSLDREEQKVLKGSRFLLLRNYDSLLPDHKSRLDELLAINRPLFTLHSLKEQFRLFWELPDQESAESFLANWCEDAFASGIKPLIKVAKTIAGYRTGIFSFFKHRITNGGVEGLINKIKTLKRQAYGFRDVEYFTLRLYHLHTQRYSLTG